MALVLMSKRELIRVEVLARLSEGGLMRLKRRSS